MAEGCRSGDCPEEVVCAIGSRAPSNKRGLVSTIYQFPEDAPKNTTRYCMVHGLQVAGGLVRLSDATTDVQMVVVRG